MTIIIYVNKEISRIFLHKRYDVTRTDIVTKFYFSLFHNNHWYYWAEKRFLCNNDIGRKSSFLSFYVVIFYSVVMQMQNKIYFFDTWSNSYIKEKIFQGVRKNASLHKSLYCVYERCSLRTKGCQEIWTNVRHFPAFFLIFSIVFIIPWLYQNTIQIMYSKTYSRIQFLLLLHANQIYLGIVYYNEVTNRPRERINKFSLYKC